MAKYTTHAATFTFGGTNVGKIKSTTFDPGTRALVDVTPVDAKFKKYRAGNISGATGSITVQLDTADAGQAAMVANFDTGGTALVASAAITYNPTGATGANYSFTGYLTNCTGGVSVNGSLECTFMFKAAGAITLA